MNNAEGIEITYREVSGNSGSTKRKQYKGIYSFIDALNMFSDQYEFSPDKVEYYYKDSGYESFWR